MSDEPTSASRRRFLGGVAAVAGSAAALAAGATPASALQEQETCPADVVDDSRLGRARQVRARAAELASSADPVEHRSCGDERADYGYALSFTKGLAHDYRTGLVARTADFDQLVAAIDSGNSHAFRTVPLGPDPLGPRPVTEGDRVRGWETPIAGSCFNLSGFDPQSLTMPPAPKIGSSELTAEMVELYAQAVLRDRPLASLRHDASASASRDRMLDALRATPWFDAEARISPTGPGAALRRRVDVNLQTAFRGRTPGETTGPYLSQLLLIGSPSFPGGAERGLVAYGAQAVDQRVRLVAARNFMTGWDDWFDVNNGRVPTAVPLDTGGRRFITTGRDLATYVHTDALYQAYLNACLVLLSNGFPLDPSLPFQQPDEIDHQQGFALYAMQHILSLLGEVCDRALKTVLFQKFNVHRRLRPEALAGRIERSDLLGIPAVATLARSVNDSEVAEPIRRLNATESGVASMLLPMAYPEGSPMHPSYGAGHATVAGACVTVLKAFFDHTRRFDVAGDPERAYVPTVDGSQLAVVNVHDAAGNAAELTVEGELNKLAANIAIGRNWAGVHYYSDYWESILLGEQIAIGMLREHMLTVGERPQLRLPRFDGSRMWL